MTISIRLYILASDDTLYRIAGTKFTAMINDPESHPLLLFADQRVRTAEAIVELDNRVPSGIYRLVFAMLRFDAHGVLDIKTFMRQNFALFEGFHAQQAISNAVVDAESRFVAQGGRWKPTAAIEFRIRQTALGKAVCKRL